MMLTGLWSLVHAAPVLSLFVGIAGVSIVTLGLAFWIKERRLQRLWAIEEKRDALLRERDRIWKDGP